MLVGIILMIVGGVLLFRAFKRNGNKIISLLVMILGLILVFMSYKKKNGQESQGSMGSKANTVRPVTHSSPVKPSAAPTVKPLWIKGNGSGKPELPKKMYYSFPLTVQPPLSAPFIIQSAADFVKTVDAVKGTTSVDVLSKFIPVVNLSNIESWRKWANEPEVMATYQWIKEHDEIFRNWTSLSFHV